MLVEELQKINKENKKWIVLMGRLELGFGAREQCPGRFLFARDIDFNLVPTMVHLRSLLVLKSYIESMAFKNIKGC